MITDLKAVDEYILGFPLEIQLKHKLIRQTIKDNAPLAIEGVAYGMSAYKVNDKTLVYFGACDKHVGFYPTPSVVEEFKNEFLEYVHGKGSVQFLYNHPLSLELISKIIRFKLSEINEK